MPGHSQAMVSIDKQRAHKSKRPRVRAQRTNARLKEKMEKKKVQTKEKAQGGRNQRNVT